MVPGSDPKIPQREYLQRVGSICLAPGVSGRGRAPEWLRAGTLSVGLLVHEGLLSTVCMESIRLEKVRLGFYSWY